MKILNIGIVGATGAVGHEFLKLLLTRNFPVKNLRLFASKTSAGKTIVWNGQEITVQELSHDSFDSIDVVFFSAGAQRSAEFASSAVKAGALVIDLSSHFRMDEKIPLVVPECNPEDALLHQGIIANPNCATIQMAVTLKPIVDCFGIQRVSVATYQSVSGAGVKGIQELENQIAQFARGQSMKPEAFSSQILMNLIPQIDVFLENDYTKEEMKIVNETRKILHLPGLRISATCVRVPVLRSHSEVIQVETKKPINRTSLIELFQKSSGIIVKDEPVPNGYPMPLEALKSFETWVGRIRKDISLENGVSYWCVADQLYKGAALNAVQIAEYLLKAGKL